MRMNPVLENEMKRNMRSMKSSWVVFGINLLLTIISVAAYFGTASPGGYLSSGQYRYPVKCYMIIAYTLFFMICLLVPGITGGSIAIERERKTLDILLTTHLSPWKIVFGKLESSLSMIFLIAFSTLPAVSLILIFGGVSVVDLLALVVILVISGIFIGSIGIFCSAMIRKSTVATVVSYVIVMMLILGTVAVLMAGHFFLEMRAQQMGIYDSVNMGNGIYLLLLNPLCSYFGLLSHQVGSGNELLEICNYYGEYSGSTGVRHMLLISILVQILLSAILLYAAGKNINPLRK